METKKKLYRSRSNQVIGGVCAGIADYFEIDPVIVRVIAVALLVLGNFPIAALYILLLVVIPEEPLDDESPKPTHMPEKSTPHTIEAAPEEKVAASSKSREEGRANIIGGLVLVAIGAAFLVENFIPALDFGKLWPVILVAVGLGMLWNASRKR